MVFHLARSIPAVVALAATMTLSLGSRDEAVSSFVEDSSLSLLQRQSIGLWNMKSSSDTANATSASKVVYVKTHFTGSGTLTGIFQRYCDHHNVTCACDVPEPGSMSIPRLKRYVEKHRGEKVDIWPWHVQYDPKPFHELIPGALTVSMFREPKARIRSGYSHDWYSAERVRLRLNTMKNNRHVYCESPMHSHVSKLSYLDMVLLTEDYDRGIVLLAQKLGWPLQTLLYVRRHESTMLNLTQDHLQALDEFFAYVEQPSERLTEAARTWKHECFGVDGDLYRAANKTYHEQLQNLTHKESHEVERGLALLQSANEVLTDCCSKQPHDAYCSVMDETPRCFEERTAEGRPPPDHGKGSACHIRALQKLRQDPDSTPNPNA